MENKIRNVWWSPIRADSVFIFSVLFKQEIAKRLAAILPKPTLLRHLAG
jgi:hypothetical protein